MLVCHPCVLAGVISRYLDFDTKWGSVGAANSSGARLTIGELLAGTGAGREGLGRGMACVSNFGNWANWTAHILSASNTYTPPDFPFFSVWFFF